MRYQTGGNPEGYTQNPLKRNYGLRYIDIF